MTDITELGISGRLTVSGDTARMGAGRRMCGFDWAVLAFRNGVPFAIDPYCRRFVEEHQP